MTAAFSTGTFASETLTTGYNPRDISQTYVTDLDGDGNDDLLILAASYPYQGAAVPQPGLVAFGTGGGSFALATPSQFPLAALTTVHPREVVFADFNADGFKDVFIADHGYDATPFPGQQNRLFLSNGDGTWRDATATLPQISDFTHSASTADIDGDGDLDILAGNVPTPNPVNPYLLINDGNGVFTRADLLPTAAGQYLNPANVRISSSTLADFDGDGLPDIVAGASFSTPQAPRQPAIIWNHGGSFVQNDTTALPFPATFGQSITLYDSQAIDVNRDGRLDLVLSYVWGNSLAGWELQVLINEGNHTFSDQTTTYLPDPASRTGGVPVQGNAESQYWVQFIRPADINGDGRIDFTLDARGTTSAPAAMPVAYVQQADGSFATAKAGELAPAMPWMFDYSTQYATWVGGSGFVHVANFGNATHIDTLPVQFTPVEPAWQGFSDAVNRVGTSGDDHLFGGMNRDTFRGLGGNDVISGGEGIDTAYYLSPRASYQAAQANGSITVQGGADGTDTLTGVERLAFTDRSVAFDLDGNAGMVARILGAVFGPAAVGNADFAGIGLAFADQGMGYEALMELALEVKLQGAASNAAVVALLYENVIGVAPSAGELASYTGMVDDGTFTQASIGVFAAETVFNADRIGLAGLMHDGLDYLA